MSTLLLLTNIPTPYRTNFFNALAVELGRRGCRLLVAYCAHSEWHRNWPFDRAANRYDYRFLKGHSQRAGALTFHFNPGILGLLRRERPRWLLSAGAWSMPTGLLALAHRRLAGGTSVFWSEGHADAVMHRTGWQAVFRRRVLRRYDAFAVPNARSAAFVTSEVGGEPRFLPLPNTVDDGFFRPPTGPERAIARTACANRPEQKLIVKVARLEHRKGAEECCEAFAAVAREAPTLKFALIGTGTLEASLRRRFADLIRGGRLVMPGSLGQEDVRRWLFASDAFLLASRRDPNPLSSIEAALCGVPLLLSRFVGNVGELIGPGDEEWIVQSIEPPEILRVFRLVADTPADTLAERGLRGVERARRHFLTANVAQNFVESLLEAFPAEATSA